MNKIKFICCLSLYFCFIIFISTLHIRFIYKVIIFALIASFLVVYYTISIFTKSYSDFIFGTFIQIIFKELPPKDIESLIINNVFLTKYNHTFNSIDQIQNDILTFAENNFSKESINIIEKAIEQYLDIIKNLESYINTKSIKRMTTKDILQKNLANTFINIINSSTYNKLHKAAMEDLIFSIPYFLYMFLNIFFIYVPNKIYYIILLPTFITLIILHIVFLRKRITFSVLLISLSWISLLISTIFSPILLSINTFNKSVWKFWHIVIVTIILIGIWITNEMWTFLDIEKRNSGTFFPKDKFWYAFEAKAMKKIRYCWLWVAFFILIFGIILMYSFIYINFNLGTKYECIMMSLEAYFIGSSNNMYVMTETIVAFFINTLYISNIVKLILEPKLKNPDI